MKPHIDSDAWQRLRARYDELEPLSVAEREERLGRLAREEPQLVAQLRAMLEAGDEGLKPLEVRDTREIPSLTDRVIDGFRIGRRVGSGGMGQVFEARQLEPERRVAFKTLRSGGPGRHGAERVVREARLLGSLSHASLAQVYASGVVELEGQPVPWFAMEFVESAEALLDAAATRELDARARLELMLQVVRGIEHVHARGIVHRDLKSSNVLVSDSGAVKVIDFGIASAAGPGAPLTRTGDVLGTLGAMAPEQARGAGGAVGPAADVYALGALLYELLCGVPPLALGGLDLLEAAEHLQREPIRRPVEAERTLGPDVRWVLTKALEKRPADRYPNAGALAADLERLAERRAVSAGPPTTRYRVQSFVRRNRALVAVGALVAVSLLLGLAGVLWGLVRARASAEIAAADRDSAFQLVAGRSLEQLIAEQAELWPPLPERLERMDRWTERARALVARAPELRASAEQAARRPGDRWNAFDPVLGQRPLDWLAAELGEVLDSLEHLADPERGPLGDGLGPPYGWGVARRRAVAAGLAEASASPGAIQAWVELERRCAGSGDELARRLGRPADLLPLGPDPLSGLEEFAVLTSGAPPARDAAGALDLDADSALVLVAIPAGSWWTGMQFTDPEAPGYVERFLLRSGYPKQRQLDAFLISKFELSNAQWRRLGAADAAVDPNATHFQPAPLLPVEFSSNAAVAETLDRFGLRLPTILEWEVAARGGTGTRWWFGDDPQGAADHANLADAALRAAGWEGNEASVGWDGNDGFAMAAPVNSMAPNPFGLHHVIGNVDEWVRLRFALQFGASGEPGPITERPGIAGGSYTTRVEDTASAAQTEAKAEQGKLSVGIRPMRDLPDLE